MKAIKLSNCEVKIKDSLKWGEAENIMVELQRLDKDDVAGQVEMQYKLLTIAIVEILEDGKNVPFSKEWMRGLDLSDALTLVEEASALVKKNAPTSFQSLKG